MVKRDLTKCLKHAQDLLSLIQKGTWPHGDSKKLAKLQCERLIEELESCSAQAEPNRILDEAEEETENHQGAPGKQKNKDSDLGATSLALNPIKSNEVAQGGSELRKTTIIGIEKTTKDLNLLGEDEYKKWRKYGEKIIKKGNVRYPRLYFSCADSNCPMKKQVQQIDEKKIEVTHIGNHNHPAHPGSSQLSMKLADVPTTDSRSTGVQQQDTESEAINSPSGGNINAQTSKPNIDCPALSQTLYQQKPYEGLKNQSTLFQNGPITSDEPQNITRFQQEQQHNPFNLSEIPLPPMNLTFSSNKSSSIIPTFPTSDPSSSTAVKEDDLLDDDELNKLMADAADL